MGSSGEPRRKQTPGTFRKNEDASIQTSAKRIVPQKAKAVCGPAVPPEHIPTHEAIQYSAYVKWLAAGQPNGDGLNFWLQAERELMKGM